MGAHVECAVVACMAVAALSGCMTTPPAPGPITFREGCEAGLGGGSMGTNLPDDPKKLEGMVAWRVKTTESHALTGSAGLDLFLDGRQDDGSVRIGRLADASAGTT